MIQSWKTRARSLILDQGKFLKVELHSIELPDGRLIPDWPWVITPDYVNIVAITPENKFLCFRQTKYGIEGSSLAPMGGYLEPGEEPLAAAKRELLEEAGYEAPLWISLGQYRVDANRGAGTAYPFLAREAVYMGKVTSDDLEEQELLHLSRAEVEAALDAGEFKVLGWAMAVALALRYLP